MVRLRPRRLSLSALIVFVVFAGFFVAVPLLAKTEVDFNPDADFSKYKTFAYVGGVENLLMFQVNPDLVSERVHHAVVRELSKKGLREVLPTQNPDLVIRFWAAPSSQVNVSTMGNWGPYQPFISSYWEPAYDDLSSASNVKEGCLLIDLIDSRTKALSWRLYLIHKITLPEKEWKKADEELTKGFESFPPTEKEIDAKKKERAEHPPKTN
jgi:WD40 repeat protein